MVSQPSEPGWGLPITPTSNKTNPEHPWLRTSSSKRLSHTPSLATIIMSPGTEAARHEARLSRAARACGTVHTNTPAAH